MSEKTRRGLRGLVTLMLLACGVWQVIAGEEAFGAGLIGATVCVSIVQYRKRKRIKELQAKGMNPEDERAYAISYKAGHSALNTGIMLAALYVLIGSMAGPQITVNPYNFLGICLAIVVFIYLIFYFYYNSKM